MSGLCVVHCVVSAALLAMASAGLITFTFHSSELHWLFILPVFLMACLSFPFSRKRHGDNRPLLYATAGLAILVFALLLETFWHLHEIETLLTMVGGGILIYAHLRNRKLNQQILL